MRKLMIAAALAAAGTTAAVPAAAQLNNQQGLVSVNIQDVTILENFLNDTQIAALNNLNVPITVQAPIGIAANVCGVSAAVLGRSGNTNPTCQAKSGSRALAQLVSRQHLQQNR
jgi:hypothetical protein